MRALNIRDSLIQLTYLTLPVALNPWRVHLRLLAGSSTVYRGQS